MLLPRLQPYHTLPCNCRPNQSMTHNTIPYPILSQQYNENLDIILYNVLYLLWRIDTIPYCTIPCLRLRDILTHTPDIHRYVIANVELKEGLRLRNIPGFRAVFFWEISVSRDHLAWRGGCETVSPDVTIACLLAHRHRWQMRETAAGKLCNADVTHLQMCLFAAPRIRPSILHLSTRILVRLWHSVSAFSMRVLMYNWATLRCKCNTLMESESIAMQTM